MAEENPLDRILDKVVGRFEAMSDTADRTNTPDLGTERLTPSEFRRRWQNMDNITRQRLLEQLGPETILQGLR